MSDAPGEPTDTATEATAGPASERADAAGTSDDGSASDAARTSDAADLDRIARDLDGVDAALRRLDDGTYWSDEITGAAIPDEVLAADPTARRADAPTSTSR